MTEAHAGLELPDYEKMAREIEDVAEMVRQHPELNHQAAERLVRIAEDIRKDGTLALANPQPWPHRP